MAGSRVRTAQELKELELAAERLVEKMLEESAEQLVETKIEKEVEDAAEQIAVEKITIGSLAPSTPPAESSITTPQEQKGLKCRIHNPGYNEGPFVCTCFESVGTKHAARKKRALFQKEENMKQKTCRIHGSQIYGSDYDDRPFKCTCFD